MINDLWNGDQMMDELQEEAAAIIEAAAVTLQTAAIADYRAKNNPAPHDNPARRGEFPRVRTGNLAAGILRTPTTRSAIRDLGYIRVGYAASAFYGISLGGRGWKWLLDTLDAQEQNIREVLGRAGSFRAVT